MIGILGCTRHALHFLSVKYIGGTTWNIPENLQQLVGFLHSLKATWPYGERFAAIFVYSDQWECWNRGDVGAFDQWRTATPGSSTEFPVSCRLRVGRRRWGEPAFLSDAPPVLVCVFVASRLHKLE